MEHIQEPQMKNKIQCIVWFRSWWSQQLQDSWQPSEGKWGQYEIKSRLAWTCGCGPDSSVTLPIPRDTLRIIVYQILLCSFCRKSAKENGHSASNCTSHASFVWTWHDTPIVLLKLVITSTSLTQWTNLIDQISVQTYKDNMYTELTIWPKKRANAATTAAPSVGPHQQCTGVGGVLLIHGSYPGTSLPRQDSRADGPKHDHLHASFLHEGW